MKGDLAQAFRDMEGDLHTTSGLSAVVRLLGELPQGVDILHPAIFELGAALETNVDRLLDRWRAARATMAHVRQPD